MATILSIAFALVLGSLAAWQLTVPLHRFKEFRPKSPRDIAAEVGGDGNAPQIIRAAYRQAICPSCHHHYRAADVVPVVSWFRGCPGCGTRLPATVPLLQLGVPLALALTVVSLFTFAGNWAVVVPFVWLVIVLSGIAVVDHRIWLIPYWMPWLGSAVGLVLIVFSSLALGKPGAILYALGGGAALFGLFFLLWLIAPAKIGFGDVRLALLIGLNLGWLHPLLPIYGLLFGSLAALTVGVVSIARRNGSRFAFGPALALGTLCAVWFAGPILG